MTLKIKNVLKLIEKHEQTPCTSEKFPLFNGHHGLCYEMRFFPSNFSKNSASLYIDVARSYLNKKAKSRQHNIIDVPAMDITVSLSYDSDGAACSGAESSEIKTVTLSTEKQTINCGSDHEAVGKGAVVAAFPQLVSHSELELTAVKGKLLVISVNMTV